MVWGLGIYGVIQFKVSGFGAFRSHGVDNGEEGRAHGGGARDINAPSTSLGLLES